jgi:hypothetical protein
VQSCVDKTLGPLCQIKALQLELSGASPAGAVVVGRSASERETDLGDSHFFVAAEGLALGEGPDSVWLLMAHQSVVNLPVLAFPPLTSVVPGASRQTQA